MEYKDTDFMSRTDQCESVICRMRRNRRKYCEGDFRKNENINWVYPDDYENQEDMLKVVFEIINEFLKENRQ